MNARLVILLASLGANVALATFIAAQRLAPVPSVQAAGADNLGASPDPSSDLASENSRGQATTNAMESPASSPAFRWSQLESTDYKEYIVRLRTFGVSERVIRDIILADVQKMYRPRFAALRPPKKPANPNFWETRNQGFYPNRAQTKEQREQTRALRKEQTELIKALLGADAYEHIAKDSGYPDWGERMYGPLSKEARDKVTEMAQRFDEDRLDIYAKADGYIDQDAMAELATLRRKHREELAAVLSPEQLEEYELRSSEVAQRMKWELAWFEPDEQEFRAIHAVKETEEDLSGLLNPACENDEATRAQIKILQEKQAELNKKLIETLGTNRAREYQLANQYEYHNLLEAGVAKETVFKMADMQGEVELAAQKVRQDQSLSGDQQTEALRAIRAETEKTLTELIGDRRAKYYLNTGAWWLRNLPPPP